MTRSVLITGGAGFIGSNLAHHILRAEDATVHILDNLSRRGASHNLAWLRETCDDPSRLRITEGDVRDAALVHRAVASATEIYHLAAQVAVTTSLVDPRLDFEVNLGGTINVLEAARQSGNRPFLIFTSTNKVYGDMSDRTLVVTNTRYCYSGTTGISESHPLDFHSPYGCSKGAADQYVRDYARIYDLPAVVFRMSCIAGQQQLGTEDQGWVAHFLYSAIQGKTLVVYGDGKQVRDVLNVKDLLRAFDAARLFSPQTGGKIYNIGGGPANTTSLLELIRDIELRTGTPISVVHDQARPGDQLIYVTDFHKFKTDTGWTPSLNIQQTTDDILAWWKRNHQLIAAEGSSIDGSGELATAEMELPRIA